MEKNHLTLGAEMENHGIIQTPYGFYVLEGDTHISRWCVENQRLDHDQNMLPIVLQHINPGDTVIDIGAFIGDHTIAYSRRVSDHGRVFAFEPFRRSFECLKLNMASLKNVTCINDALGLEGNEIGFNESPNVGATFASEGRQATTKSLDTFRLMPHFIKIDAEGMEVDIIRGGINTIKGWKPKMLIEVNKGALERNGQSPESLFSLLSELGYAFQNVYPNQPMSGHQYDVMCIPKMG